jgi:hypothetical protein
MEQRHVHYIHEMFPFLIAKRDERFFWVSVLFDADSMSYGFDVFVISLKGSPATARDVSLVNSEIACRHRGAPSPDGMAALALERIASL